MGSITYWQQLFAYSLSSSSIITLSCRDCAQFNCAERRDEPLDPPRSLQHRAARRLCSRVWRTCRRGASGSCARVQSGGAAGAGQRRGMPPLPATQREPRGRSEQLAHMLGGQQRRSTLCWVL